MQSIRLIDIHTHVNFNAFRDDADAVIRRALDAGVGMILVGSQIDTSRRAVEFVNKYPEGVYAAVGLHPIHLMEGHWDQQEIGAPRGVVSGFTPLETASLTGFTSRREEFHDAAYKELGEDKKTVAIGECGLDYFRVASNEETKKLQQETFRKQIQLARALKKPLMVHCRNAYEDVLQILQEEKAGEIGGNIHFFAGDWETALKFLDFGFYLSFTGVITFAQQYDEVIKNIPLDRIMIETDSPYVAPAPYRGRRNEPLYVAEVAKRVAELRGISYNEIARVTTKNAQRLFGI